MQQTNETARRLLEELRTPRLILYPDGQLYPGEILSGRYTASVCGSDSFTIGNACASSLELVLDGIHRYLYQKPVEIRWSVIDGEEYPLISGNVDKVTVSGGRSTVQIYDRMYTTGGGLYRAADSCLTACTGADVLRDIAGQMGVSVDAGTLTAAAQISLADGVENLGDQCSLASAAGTVAALMGGNAVINRAGALAVVRYAATAWESECYQAGDAADNENWTPANLTFQRTDKIRTTGEDGVVTEEERITDYTAGGEGAGVAQANQLATQALVNGAFAQIQGLVIHAGAYTVPGGLLCEPGDVVTLDGYTVPIMGLSLSYDGGVKATITAVGQAAEAGVSQGPVTEQLKKLKMEFGEFKQLTVEQLRAWDVIARNVFAENVTATGTITGAKITADEFTYLDDFIRILMNWHGIELTPLDDYGYDVRIGLNGVMAESLEILPTGVFFYPMTDYRGTPVGLLPGNGCIECNGNFSVEKDLDLGGSQYTANVRGIWTMYKGNEYHTIVARMADGLTSVFGWSGSASYQTITEIRGRTVQYRNASGATVLSDERIKRDWKNLEEYDRFFDKLNPQAYRYIDGSSGRYHVGFGAQSVERALKETGLSNQDFGGLIRKPGAPDSEYGFEEEYGLIYTEFVALLTDQVQKLKSRVAELEARLDRLEGKGAEG